METKKLRGLMPSSGIWITVVFILMLVGLSLTHYDPWTLTGALTQFPECLTHDRLMWVYNTMVPIVAVAFYIYCIVQSVKAKQLTWWFLFAICAMTLFPFEAVADWGGCLTYNPDFPYFNLHGSITFPWHINELPYFQPFAYSVYWGGHSFLLASAILWLRKKTGWSFLKVFLLIALPIGYLLDLAVEGMATFMGWWQYEEILGPYIDWNNVVEGHTGTFPLVYPIFISQIWPSVIAILADKNGESKYELHKIDKFFHLELLLPNDHPSSPNYIGDPEAAPKKFAWKFELVRLITWFGVFQWSYWLCMCTPLLIIRYAAQHQSWLHPWPVLAEGASPVAGFVLLAVTAILCVLVLVIDVKRRDKALLPASEEK